MPIFISYSQKDTKFVDTLVRNLVAAKHHVWMDRWELSLGDSLTKKIESALTESSAMLVILSKDSVDSEWCKRELTAGLVRELEERKTVVMPCVIDDCKVPLFLRDKLYADFRKDPDEAFRLVDRSLARVSNPFQGRGESPKFHTDWAIDWTKDAGPWVFRLTFIDHGHDWPYVIHSQCSIICDDAASAAFDLAVKKERFGDFIRDSLASVVESCRKKPLTEVIDNHFEKFVAWKVKGNLNFSYTIMYTYRRLGIDNGMSTLVHLDNNLETALQHMIDVGLDGGPAQTNGPPINE